MKNIIFAFLLTFFISYSAGAQHSVAQEWSEVLLTGIRKDFARPTVHSRNLFHASVAMYDAWAAYEDHAETFFLGDSLGSYYCPFNGMATAPNKLAAQEEAISYAMFRLMRHRFDKSPGRTTIYTAINNLFITNLGFDASFTSTDYSTGNPAALGNYIAQHLIAFGLQDGANEANVYDNLYYRPVNATLIPRVNGNPNMTNANRWQPLTLDVFIDQAGNVLPRNTPDFLSPEWGEVVPFALPDSSMTIKRRNNQDWKVWVDPGAPPYINTAGTGGSEAYKWGFSMVSVWASHLDPSDTTMVDISPAAIGNVDTSVWPDSYSAMTTFYNYLDGGDIGTGRNTNPTTGQSYAPNLVKRSDYTRVLAEFWADGPDSETPPGHWFSLLNYVLDHPQFEPKWKGEGGKVDPLEYHVKAYLSMGGAMHDAAIAAWSVKGYYDYLRPISAIRFMARLGQCTDTAASNYNVRGIPLEPGFIETIQLGDPLAGNSNQHVGKIKLYTWRGPSYITNPANTTAGVGWIRAERWWPYQRPSFVTPPFAGFVSGHSTFSRAAAEIMTSITGDEYFPGGMGEFTALKNQFLVFEDGPTDDVVLQWATYRDASDQTSLSRIWGGIHPPADDIPGRRMGIYVGENALKAIEKYTDGNGIPDVVNLTVNKDSIADVDAGLGNLTFSIAFEKNMDTTWLPILDFPNYPAQNSLMLNPALSSWNGLGTYEAVFDVIDTDEELMDFDIRIVHYRDKNGIEGDTTLLDHFFDLDMMNPSIGTIASTVPILSDVDTGKAEHQIVISFDEAMHADFIPSFIFPIEDPMANSLIYNSDSSRWLTNNQFMACFDVIDADEELLAIDVNVELGKDLFGNDQIAFMRLDFFDIDTENPTLVSISPSSFYVSDASIGTGSFEIVASFSEAINSFAPSMNFPIENPTLFGMQFNAALSSWINPSEYKFAFDVNDLNTRLDSIDLEILPIYDLIGNKLDTIKSTDVFSLDTDEPILLNYAWNINKISDAEAANSFLQVITTYDQAMDLGTIPQVFFPVEDPSATFQLNAPLSSWTSDRVHVSTFTITDANEFLLDVDLGIRNGMDSAANLHASSIARDVIDIDTENPRIDSIHFNHLLLSDSEAGLGAFIVDLLFNEAISSDEIPSISFPQEDPKQWSLTLNTDSTKWISSKHYRYSYNLLDAGEELLDIDIEFTDLKDAFNNELITVSLPDTFNIDTENPTLVNLSLNLDTIRRQDRGTAAFSIMLNFSEAMQSSQAPGITFPVENATRRSLVYNTDSSEWISSNIFSSRYDILSTQFGDTLFNIDILADKAKDDAGNIFFSDLFPDVFSILIQDALASSLISISDDELSLYPNPAHKNQFVSLVTNTRIGTRTVSILNAEGRILRQLSLDAQEQLLQLDMSEFASGIYLIEVESNGRRAHKKLILY